MKGWVYYCDDDRGRIKIGYSVNPLGRLAEFRTVNPELNMLLRERGYRELERKRHAQFSTEHIAGEWFLKSDRLCEWIDFQCAIVRLQWGISSVWLTPEAEAMFVQPFLLPKYRSTNSPVAVPPEQSEVNRQPVEVGEEAREGTPTTTVASAIALNNSRGGQSSL